jgi:hypothetical protein
MQSGQLEIKNGIPTINKFDIIGEEFDAADKLEITRSYLLLPGT